MLIIKRLEVEPKIVIEKDCIPVRMGLTGTRNFRVYIHEVIEAAPRLTCIANEGLVTISVGTRLRIRNPAVLYRSCNGDVVASIVRHGDVIEVYTHRELCWRRALSDGFCPIHKSGEYRSYLNLVFGRSERLSKELGLAMVPHMLYAMYVGGNSIKVGIANAMKNVGRLFEQVFVCATILAFLANAYEARKIEAFLGKHRGLSERFNVRDRIHHLVACPSVSAAVKSFVARLALIVFPHLRQVINVREKEFIPLIGFSDELLDRVRKARYIYTVEQLNSIEGEYEVEAYAPGGVVLSEVRGNNRVFVPYQIVRNLALNASLAT